MLIGSKIMLTAIIFIIVGAIMASFGEDMDEDWSLMIGVCVLLLSAVGFIVGLLMNIWS